MNGIRAMSIGQLLQVQMAARGTHWGAPATVEAIERELRRREGRADQAHGAIIIPAGVAA